MDCNYTINDRRRVFWVTQPETCGERPTCDQNCGIPGLKLIPVGQMGTISTEIYLRGLILNILMTDGKKLENKCGFTPGTRGGHWSSSFVGVSIGSNVRDIPTDTSVKEAVGLIKAHVFNDMQKLIKYGVASSVEVEAKYKGNNTIDLTIIVFGNDGSSTRVGVSGTRTTNSWAWN